MPEFWFWNNKFRMSGVLLGMAYHVAMFAMLIWAENPEVSGYRWLFSWYMPSVALGLPWSIPVLFLGALIPGVSVLGLAAAVCLNGYLIGWPLDAIFNHQRRQRRRRILQSYLQTPAATPLQG